MVIDIDLIDLIWYIKNINEHKLNLFIRYIMEVARMPKAFSEAEKNMINNKLIEAGQDLFSRFGLKKTGIKDITEAAGISQGSFYSFYSSKEELYFTILETEEEKIQEEILDSDFFKDEITAQSFKDFLMKSFQLIDKNQLIKRLYQNQREYQQIVRKLPEEKIEDHIKSDTEKLMPLITSLQEKNKIIEEKPEVISGLLRSLFLLSLHREEIGEEIYPDTIELLIDLISRGLIKE